MTNPPDELLAVTLARIETKLDNAISSNADHERRLRVLEERLPADLPVRLRQLEGARWPLPSVAVAVSIAGVVLSYVMR